MVYVGTPPPTFRLGNPFMNRRHHREVVVYEVNCWRPKYKVVQIWPGLFVCKQVTVFPGHIWTTLYFVGCERHETSFTIHPSAEFDEKGVQDPCGSLLLSWSPLLQPKYGQQAGFVAGSQARFLEVICTLQHLQGISIPPETKTESEVHLVANSARAEQQHNCRTPERTPTSRLIQKQRTVYDNVSWSLCIVNVTGNAVARRLDADALLVRWAACCSYEIPPVSSKPEAVCKVIVVFSTSELANIRYFSFRNFFACCASCRFRLVHQTNERLHLFLFL